EVELSVGRNAVHALVGPNGSGKTTLLNVLSGIYKPTTGRLFFDGQPVTRLLPHERAGRGIGRTFQNVRLFTSMSVLENIIVGAERPGNAVAIGSNGVEQHALAAGLNSVKKSELVQLLKRLKGHGLTILVIDHDMNLVEQVADRITVLNFGRRI